MLVLGNGKVITRDAACPLIENGAVAIDGTTICKVSSTEDIKNAYPEAEYIDAKGGLIKKALGAQNLGIEVLEDRVVFPWFPEMPEADSVKAYTHFISALCEMSKNAKRVTATEKSVDNEKYAFRCFLLRLGFIGSEYKAERKILLKNLTGSSAFKNGGVGHAVSE